MLPIDIFYDDELKMLRCQESEFLVETLNNVYLQGSLVDGSISSESGVVYVPQLVDFIVNNCQSNRSARILEIGFGKGIILKNLKERGFKNLLGIEPGNHEMLPGMEQIEIVNDFFPSNMIEGKLDIICHFAVWEHISDPVQFIKNQLTQLNEEGAIIFGVPNCEPYVKKGDLSMFLHEHYSYFTSESIEKTVILAGGSLEYIQVIEGMLVGRITNINAAAKPITPDMRVTKGFGEKHYWENVEYVNNALKTFFSNYSLAREVAVYVPGRCINALYLLGLKEVRLVDDNSEMRNRYLPYFESAIESFEDVCLNPPTAILVYSHTFGNRIKEKCLKDARLKYTLVVTIDEIVE